MAWLKALYQRSSLARGIVEACQCSFDVGLRIVGCLSTSGLEGPSDIARRMEGQHLGAASFAQRERLGTKHTGTRRSFAAAQLVWGSPAVGTVWRTFAVARRIEVANSLPVVELALVQRAQGAMQTSRPH